MPEILSLGDKEDVDESGRRKTSLGREVIERDTSRLISIATGVG
jgi:hypothetical protein